MNEKNKKYNIITEKLSKVQADKLYLYLVKLQDGNIPIRFNEVQ